MSGRRSVSPILVQTCCDELSREPPSSCQQAKGASTAQSQAGFLLFLLKYFSLKADRAEEPRVWANIPASVGRSACVNSPVFLNVW